MTKRGEEAVELLDKVLQKYGIWVLILFSIILIIYNSQIQIQLNYGTVKFHFEYPQPK